MDVNCVVPSLPPEPIACARCGARVFVGELVAGRSATGVLWLRRRAGRTYRCLQACGSRRSARLRGSGASGYIRRSVGRWGGEAKSGADQEGLPHSGSYVRGWITRAGAASPPFPSGYLSF